MDRVFFQRGGKRIGYFSSEGADGSGIFSEGANGSDSEGANGSGIFMARGQIDRVYFS